MPLLDRLHERRAELRQRQAQGEKGSIIVWLYIVEIFIQLFRLWRGK
jgi:hypothetical protein